MSAAGLSGRDVQDVSKKERRMEGNIQGETEMKRYRLDMWEGDKACHEWVEDPNGEWVKWEDVENDYAEQGLITSSTTIEVAFNMVLRKLDKLLYEKME